MKETVKTKTCICLCGASAALGITAGAVASLLYFKKAQKLIEKKKLEEKDYEIETLRNLLKAKIDQEKTKKPVVVADETAKKEQQAASALSKGNIDDIIKAKGYTDYAHIVTPVKEEPEEEKDISEEVHATATPEDSSNVQSEPYVISPDKFGLKDDYELVTYTYYRDGILADEHDKEITNAYETVGEFKSHFGEYEDDAVYIRNERLKIDFEILLSYEEYTDVISKHPYLK